jgi:hypothetical protein
VHNRRPPRLIRSAGLAVAVLLVTGCASQNDTDTDPAAASGDAASSSAAAEEAATSSAAAGDDADVAPFDGDTDADVADPADPAGLTVTAVRAASHEGYDRVVFELSGSGTPGWSVEYVDTPSAQGSGEAVDVPGSAYLQVTLQGISYPYDSGAEELARGEVAVPGTEVVEGVFYDATFEGTSVAWIGTSVRDDFRVYALTGPSRLVVEVADAD